MIFVMDNKYSLVLPLATSHWQIFAESKSYF